VPPELPPPDPSERLLEPTARGPIPAATAVFPLGPPSPQADRVADRLLDLRPGLLIVLDGNRPS
jgi:hypothetical protein